MEPARKEEENPPSELPKKTNKPIRKQPPSKKKGPDAVFYEEESTIKQHPSLQQPQPSHPQHPFSGQIPHPPSATLPQQNEAQPLLPHAQSTGEAAPRPQLDDYQICKNLMRAVINIRLDYDQAKKIVSVMQVLRKRPLHQAKPKPPKKKKSKKKEIVPKEEKKVEEGYQEGGNHQKQPPAPPPPPPAPQEA